jgi:hypothetical protein
MYVSFGQTEDPRKKDDEEVDPGIELAFKMNEQFPYGGPEGPAHYWPVWKQTSADTGFFLPRYVR